VWLVPLNVNYGKPATIATMWGGHFGQRTATSSISASVRFAKFNPGIKHEANATPVR